MSGWDKIISAIEELGKNKNNSVNIRINVGEHNVRYLKKICCDLPKQLLDNPYTTIYFSPIVGQLNGNVKNTLKNRSLIVREAWKEIRANNLPIAIEPFKYAPCPYVSEKSAFYMDLKGRIYTCGGFVGKEQKIEAIYNEKKEIYKERINYIPQDSCFICEFFPVCMGSCKFEKEEIGINCQKMYLQDIYDDYFVNY